MKIHQVHKDIRPEVRYLFFINGRRLIEIYSSITQAGYVQERDNPTFHDRLIYKD
jgi:hypothetical protein